MARTPQIFTPDTNFAPIFEQAIRDLAWHNYRHYGMTPKAARREAIAEIKRRIRSDMTEATTYLSDEYPSNGEA